MSENSSGPSTGTRSVIHPVIAAASIPAGLLGSVTAPTLPIAGRWGAPGLGVAGILAGCDGRATATGSADSVIGVTIDVTDATFQTDVVDRSKTTPVVIDLWAPWCGPCRQLGPILEDEVARTGGDVVLVKVDVDENPAISRAFKVQSIPAVYAMVDGKVVDAFLGARSPAEVAAFVDKLRPDEAAREVVALLASGDEKSLRRVLEIAPDHVDATLALAELLVGDGRSEEALEWLARIPETAEVRRIAALARVGPDEAAADDVAERLETLLATVATDDSARREYLDVLELLGPQDPRTAEFRKRLTAALF
ncbi:MAG: tetratricopeptide repeat protein [Actinobacteria bacterium]|nr:tetratricopeptide repeat protein [Actinomycetota bacterium]